MSLTRRSLLACVGGALAASALARRALAEDTPTPDALTPYRDRYAALQSYSDTGTVTVEQQWTGSPVVVEGGSFTTFFRAPRNFFFEFVENPDTGEDRLAIWCDGGDFQSWWKTTGMHDVYDGGRGALAFLLALAPTMGASNVIPSLLFPAADLGGAVAGLIDVRDAGTEEMDGRSFAKLQADIVVAGSSSTERPTTMLFDPATALLHKVVEDLAPGEMLNRGTTLISPQADIEIDEARFTFAPPG